MCSEYIHIILTLTFENVLIILLLFGISSKSANQKKKKKTYFIVTAITANSVQMENSH